jgi:dihydrodipicolinate synthase/N-acetylneuraminate lyase
MLSGILPPLVTPFTAEGALDLRAFEGNLERYAEQDLGGYLVLGSNGEAASLDESEKLALIAATRKRAGPAHGGRHRPGIDGRHHRVTRSSGRTSGADAARVLTPHYYKTQMRTDALKRHRGGGDASPIPVLLYSQPAFTGLVLPPSLPAAERPSAHRGLKGAATWG